MIDYIINNINDKNVREMAEDLGIKPEKVDEVLDRIEKDGLYKPWKKIWRYWEEQYIIKHYRKTHSKIVAKTLGVGIGTYNHKIGKLKQDGLIIGPPSKKKQYNPNSPTNIYNTQSNIQGMIYSQLKESVREKVKIGERYEVYERRLKTGKKSPYEKVTEGILEDVTDALLVLRTNTGYCECFSKIDYDGFQYKFKEVVGG